MKLALLVVALACTTSAGLVEEAAVTFARYIQFPDGDGIMHNVDLSDVVDEKLLIDITQRNIYLLFTRRNPNNGQTLVIFNDQSIRNSYFNPRIPTVVVVHGWLSNRHTAINPRIRDAYLGKGEANVIVLDWGQLARANYVTAVRGVPAVGVGLGQFIRYLIQVTGARYEDIHLVGFSLGAHVVGNAGRELQGRVARVTGLDAAGPLWNLNPKRLKSGDARYVEAIHTNGGLAGLGIGYSIADADFYPNGGEFQPGCITPICNHNRAWELFAASVTYNHFIAKRCDSLLQITLNTCFGVEFPMGNDDLKKYGKGRYYLSTRWTYPY